MTKTQDEKPAFAVGLSKERTELLWQLVNAPGVAIPISKSHVAAELFADVKSAAVYHGIVAT